jgi:glycine/D-amino acid oxidase-like deaminating enzyme
MSSQAPSFWLEDCGEPLQSRPPLHGDITVDVAILGAGLSGLWTALHLLRGDPSLSVAVVERAFVGFGASGRNGGWCSPRFPVDAGSLIERLGPARARATIVTHQNMVSRIGLLCSEEGIDAQYRQTGMLVVARGEAQRADIAQTFATYQRLGLEDQSVLLSAEQAYARVKVSRLTGALLVPAGASVHPGRLVRGLARVVERRGGRIYESTEAVGISRTGERTIHTRSGTVRARRAVVAAGEAFLTGMPDFRRALLPVSSMIVLSAPLTASQWASVGWAQGESLCSQAYTKDYLTRTADGRILYGSRGLPYRLGSRMPEHPALQAESFQAMREAVCEWWPALRGLQFTHAWGGYLGVPRDWMPSVHFDSANGFAQLLGYSGRGITTAALAGELLAGLIGGWQTGLEDSPIHRNSPPQWEREPLRWLGVRYVQQAYARIDAADKAGRHRPLDTPFAEYLGEP